MKVVVVIPAFRAKNTISEVVANIPEWIPHIVVVDDGCPDGTGAFVTSTVADQRVRVVANSQNEGVGGATIKGIQKAIELNCDLVIKMDADCQMDPRYLETYAQLAQGGALYIKGNRLSQYRNYRSMPLVRLMGNLGLAMITRLGTGLREINDPTNGYIGLSRKLLDEIDLSELHRGYFFETDLLYQLKKLGVRIHQIEMPARYNKSPSHMDLPKVTVDFLYHHSKRIGQRITRKTG